MDIFFLIIVTYAVIFSSVEQEVDESDKPRKATTSSIVGEVLVLIILSCGNAHCWY